MPTVWVCTTHARPSMYVDAVSAYFQQSFSTRNLGWILSMLCDQLSDRGNSIHNTVNCLCVLCHMAKVIRHRQQFSKSDHTSQASSWSFKSITWHTLVLQLWMSLETPRIHSVNCKPDRAESIPTSAHTGTMSWPAFKESHVQLFQCSIIVSQA